MTDKQSNTLAQDTEVKPDHREKADGVALKKKKRGVGFVEFVIILSLFATILTGMYLWAGAPSQFFDNLRTQVYSGWNKISGLFRFSEEDIIPKDKDARQNAQSGLEEELQEPVYLDQGTDEYSREPIVKAVRRALPAVVSIAIDNARILPGQIVTRQEKIGSGFIVDEKGIIVTNKHVVQQAGAPYKVITNSGTSYNVVDIILDPVYDLAFVFINPGTNRLSTVALGDSNQLVLGQTVIAIGTPFGEFQSTVTSGIISGLNRKVEATDSWDFSGKIYTGVIQTDAAINPGNSGGPLLDIYGRVIGVNFAKIAGADNISFAIPINIVKMRLDQYKQYGRFVHPFLGVSVRHIDEIMSAYYNIPAGALVIQVVPGSPADKVGIRPKDIIVEIDGQSVAQLGLINIINSKKVGQVIRMRILRPQVDPKTGETRFKKLEYAVRLVDRAKFDLRDRR